MTETVWVALISGGAALLAALITHVMTARTTAQAASRAAEKEARDWQRSESRRREELHDQRLREFWSHVLMAQSRTVDIMIALGHGKPAVLAFEESGLRPAADAYALALLGLVRLRSAAQHFYRATADLQSAVFGLQLDLLPGRSKELEPFVNAWRDSFDALEAVIQQEYLPHSNAGKG